MRKIIFFDTETTGLPKLYNVPISQVDNWPRLVQLAFLAYLEDGTKVAEHNYIIKPEGFYIPKEATAIHRISNQQALQEGHEIKDVLRVFEKAISEASLLVAHNFDFDKSIVGAEFIRHHISPQSLLQTKSFCTMKDKKVVNFCKIKGTNGYRWPRLEDLYQKLFNQSLTNAHDARIDIEATANCFWELLKRQIIV